MKKSVKYYKGEADRLFSLWIRQSNTDDKGICYCCTCGEPHHWRKIHCGHFQSRGHNATRYNEKNTGAQCNYCNTFKQGEQYKFAKYIDKKHGEGTAEKLSVLARMECKRSWFDYRYIAEEYKEKLKEKGYKVR